MRDAGHDRAEPGTKDELAVARLYMALHNNILTLAPRSSAPPLALSAFLRVGPQTAETVFLRGYASSGGHDANATACGSLNLTQYISFCVATDRTQWYAVSSPKACPSFSSTR